MQKTLRREHLQDFVDCYAPGKDRAERVAADRFKAFTYDELMARAIEDLTAALSEFEAVATALEAASAPE
jgi:type I restriction enzyme M protein